VCAIFLQFVAKSVNRIYGNLHGEHLYGSGRVELVKKWVEGYIKEFGSTSISDQMRLWQWLKWSLWNRKIRVIYRPGDMSINQSISQSAIFRVA